MDEERLELQITTDGVAVVRWNNGENRMRTSTARAWCRLLTKIENTHDVKGLVVTGNGKHFSLGRDMDFLAKQDGDYHLTFTKVMEQLYKRLIFFPVPTVAVINGHTFGSGTLLALACDFRVMRSDRGWLCLPETAIGIQFRPVSMGILRAKLPQGIQQRNAILFSQRFTAAEAKTLGLVDVTSEVTSLMDEAYKLIKNALGKSGLSREAVVKMKKDIYGPSMNDAKL